MIDYDKISDGIDFYQANRFKLIDAPWIVSPEASNITLPGGRRIAKSFLGDHVGSAEQSFLELILRKELRPGRYVAASPCYRDEKEDDLHRLYFMKVELIDFLGANKQAGKESLTEIIGIASNFFNRYLPTKVISTKSGFDIVSQDKEIELGSYGLNSYKDFSWVYATGVAEPRLSQAINLKPRSYHLNDIPKGKVGEISKIREEVLELVDANSQGNRIMSLIELSDLYGAIGLHLEKHFPTFTLNDLAKMNDATQRAFKSGNR
jgi:hypothetical protein